MACLHPRGEPVADADREDDSKWPEKNKDGRQELEIRLGNEHISFEVRYNSAAPLADILLADMVADCQNRISCRCHRIRGPRRSPSFLLSRSRSESPCFLLNLLTLQGSRALILLFLSRHS